MDATRGSCDHVRPDVVANVKYVCRLNPLLFEEVIKETSGKLGMAMFGGDVDVREPLESVPFQKL
jgi:hypothetical protein